MRMKLPSPATQTFPLPKATVTPPIPTLIKTAGGNYSILSKFIILSKFLSYLENGTDGTVYYGTALF
jgi:hypothetical protein